MKLHLFSATLALATLSSAGFAATAPVIVINHRGDDAAPDFRFEQVQTPRRQDAGAKASYVLVDGRRDSNGGSLSVLNDGLLPTEDDQPFANFFFRAGSAGGRIAVDLGATVEVAAINTYSWHPGGRGPQVYAVYGVYGTNANSTAAPPRPADPSISGWVLLAKVDSRVPGKPVGGQYGVSISSASGALGAFRHLLFDILPTDPSDPFGHTFFSEIDIIDRNASAEPEPETALTATDAHRQTIQIEGGHEILLDTSETPDLTDWANQKLVPMIQEWYPKIVAMLPSDDYTAPKRVTINFRKDMQGVAATSGTRINCAANWMRRELNREAVGAVFHELVHVVQQYGRARRTNPEANPAPGWLVEGIPDYIRWFLFEPQSRGAEISARNLERARYDGSYRISANFLNYAVENFDPELVRKLNAALRTGNYAESLWKDFTGHYLEELGTKWKVWLEQRIAAPQS